MNRLRLGSPKNEANVGHWKRRRKFPLLESFHTTIQPAPTFVEKTNSVLKAASTAAVNTVVWTKTIA